MTGCSVPPYPQVVLALPDLLGYWRLDEPSGSVAKDRHGGMNNGTYKGATLGQPSLLGGDTDPAIFLDGTTAQVVIPDAPSLDLTGPFTLSALVKPSSVTGKRQIVSKTSAYWIQIVDGGLELAFVSGTSVHAIPLSVGFTVGALVHVVGTYDGQMLRVYLNGALAGSKAETGAIVADAGSPLYIGTWDGKTYFFGGEVDEVFVAASALDAAGVSALYAASLGCGGKH
jgi:hypothetical protein